ncbi:MAG TPA: hypothetical protein VLJ57_14495 [Burkholderiaceae bacterium]|nr:hypothetical protein [Burkholderiaceae bacterium]
MLIPEQVRDLRVDPLLHPRGQAHLSAASGLVRVQDWHYVVADDEHHLGVFDDIQGAVSLLRLFDGDLPHDKKKRKQAKPDLETLAALPPMPGCPHGALLALGSGSRPTRQTGVLVVLDALGCATGRIAHVDLTALYAPLRARFADLNIEGAFVASGELRLLQRGNQGDARNACISFDWNQVAPWLLGKRPAPPAVKAVQMIELGVMNGVPLGLTDGAALEHGAWVFSAVAEDTRNSFQDGPCAGSAIGLVGPDGRLRQLSRLQGSPKVEGIAVQAQGDELALTLVTDPDDPKTASQVLRVRMALLP